MDSLKLKNEFERLIKLQYEQDKNFVIVFDIAKHTGLYFFQASYTGSPNDPRGFYACLELSDDLQRVRNLIPGESNHLQGLNWQAATEIPNMHIFLEQEQSTPDEIAKFMITTLEVGLGLKAQEITIKY